MHDHLRMPGGANKHGKASRPRARSRVHVVGWSWTAAATLLSFGVGCRASSSSDDSATESAGESAASESDGGASSSDGGDTTGEVCDPMAAFPPDDPPPPSEPCGDTAELVPIPADGFCEDSARLVPEDFPFRTFDAIPLAVDPTLGFPDFAAPCDEGGRCYEYVVCGVYEAQPVVDPWPVGPTPFGEDQIVTTSGDYSHLLVANTNGEVVSVEFEEYSLPGLIGVYGQQVWIGLVGPDESTYYIGAWNTTESTGELALKVLPSDIGPLFGFIGSSGDYFWTVYEEDDLQPRLCGLRPDGTLRTVAVLADDVFYLSLFRRWRLPRQVGSWVYLYAEDRICIDEVDEGMAVREEVIFPVGEGPYDELEPPELPTVHVTDGKHVYFTADIEMCEGYDTCAWTGFRDGIWRAPVAGGVAEPLFSDLPDVADSGLALHAGWLYWAMEADQTIYRTHTETLETQEVFRPSPLPTGINARWGDTFFVHAGQLWRVIDPSAATGDTCLVRLDLASLCLPPAAHEAAG